MLSGQGLALGLFSAFGDEAGGRGRGFGLFFEGVIGLSGEPFLLNSQLASVALIIAGVILVALSLVRGRRPA